MFDSTPLTPDVNQTPAPVPPILWVSRPDWSASPWIVRHENMHRIDALLRVVAVDYQVSNTVLDVLGIGAVYGMIALEDGVVVSDAVVASAKATHSNAMEYAAQKLGMMRTNAGTVHVSAFRMLGRTLPVFLTEWRVYMRDDPAAPACRCHTRMLSHVHAQTNISYRIQDADKFEALLRSHNFVTDDTLDSVRTRKRGAE